MKIGRQVSNVLADLERSPLANLPSILEWAGISFASFFDNGVWRGLDFSAVDMRTVDFSAAIVEDCCFYYGDVSGRAKNNCLVFARNRFTYSGMNGSLNLRGTPNRPEKSVPTGRSFQSSEDRDANLREINGLIRKSVRPGESKRLFLEMVDAGIKPNRETYRFLLQSSHLHRK